MKKMYVRGHQIDMLPLIIVKGKIFFLLKIVNGSCNFFLFKIHT